MIYKYCAHFTNNNAQNLLIISLVSSYSIKVMGEQAVSLLKMRGGDSGGLLSLVYCYVLK